MNELKKEEKVFSVILRLVVICTLALGAVFFTSCEPEGCWECDNYLVNGEYSEVCVQVDDSYCDY